MLIGLLLLLDFAMFADALTSIFTKRPVLIGHAILIGFTAILLIAACVDPMSPESRIACAAIALLPAAAEIFLTAKCVQWKREAKAAQMPRGSAT